MARKRKNKKVERPARLPKAQTSGVQHIEVKVPIHHLATKDWSVVVNDAIVWEGEDADEARSTYMQYENAAVGDVLLLHKGCHMQASSMI